MVSLNASIRFGFAGVVFDGLEWNENGVGFFGVFFFKFKTNSEIYTFKFENCVLNRLKAVVKEEIMPHIRTQNVFKPHGKNIREMDTNKPRERTLLHVIHQ